MVCESTLYGMTKSFQRFSGCSHLIPDMVDESERARGVEMNFRLTINQEHTVTSKSVANDNDRIDLFSSFSEAEIIHHLLELLHMSRQRFHPMIPVILRRRFKQIIFYFAMCS